MEYVTQVNRPNKIILVCQHGDLRGVFSLADKDRIKDFCHRMKLKVIREVEGS